MKTVCQKDTNISLYLFEDDVKITLHPDQMVVGDLTQIIVSDCNVANVELHQNVNDPGNWVGWKYLHNGENWSLNPDYIEPPKLTNNDISST